MSSFPPAGWPATSLNHAERNHESAKRVGTRLLFMDQGGIAEDGHPVDLIDRPPTPRLQEFLKHVS
ncbi:amino acid ABC transporter ATP-binding protein, PAAT family [Burkholderia ambifaria AMMD]|uniref:Amino acid ABC transporter ATP-binding protein, PAAT family n=1 Tax=Burkholderia ambifaria (strain ATCC BAA-244 / DSM 16087 / CCUG 44356 / LMG 19182 / AMMD) TaxID=339670 RepID=Q0B9X5_BURCM|nr:amino acid ABC transporter ATP-binding protein, PAAT family [Burkholderia ambifaria AMMD]AJY24907.1 amino acid ABC transporter ATP-binding protein, PAAT family [Burkholderia ambifaria AMMD]